ncbi:MAG TPA: proton-conducting transporter membrane subunit [Streptosporangiaceae bacterium]|nr:proton-conducting transporter membrane subunit [Streptosporangiaceae bacterium]
MSAALFLGGLALGAGGSLAGAALPPRARLPVAAALTSGACIAAAAAAAGVLASGHTVAVRSAEILPLTGVTLSLDPLGAIFVITSAVVGAAASCYAVGYAARGTESRAAAALLPLFITSLLLVPAAASIATFMAAWELMALSSLLLLLTGHRRREARDAATWYAVMTHAGAAAILVALVLIGAHAGGESFAALRAHVGEIPPAERSIAFVLALAGFASKAGAVPLHVWLPRAHPEAPSPVSALMSGAMVNLGIYGIVRTGDGLLRGGELWWWLVVAGLGVASALFGGIHAAASTDLKRLLAYSTVDNIGLILIGVGVSGALAASGHRMLAGLAMIAALFQLINHSAFKGCLFLAAGSVQRAAGTRDLDSLGGLLRRLPATAALFGIGALSICALPPFSGFASEWLLVQSFLRAFSAHSTATSVAVLAGVAALALTGGLTAAAFVKAFGVGFLGQPRTPAAAAAGRVHPAMVGGTALLAVPCLALGVLPGLVMPLLARAAGTALASTAPGPPGPPAPLGSAAGLLGPLGSAAGLRIAGSNDVIEPALLTVALIAALVLAAWLVRVRAVGVRRAEPWGCGRELQTPRMQYTATSFAEPLQRVFADVLRPDRDLDVSHLAESRYFEEAITYHSRTDDAVERGVYRPLTVLVQRWGEVARRAQNGSMHRYLGYGFAALVVMLMLLA